MAVFSNSWLLGDGLFYDSLSASQQAQASWTISWQNASADASITFDSDSRIIAPKTFYQALKEEITDWLRINLQCVDKKE